MPRQAGSNFSTLKDNQRCIKILKTGSRCKKPMIPTFDYCWMHYPTKEK